MKECKTCANFVVANAKEVIGCCKIWHDSGKTWPKSNECCPHHEEIKEKGGNTDGEKRQAF